MSAALSHLAVGLLLGLALGVRLRWLPVAGLLALLPDIDHLSLFTPIPVWLLRTRATFHNVLFCVVLPVVVYLVIVRTRWGQDPGKRRLALAAPLLMSSHLFLDMLPLDVSSARVPLLYPFSSQPFTMDARTGFAVDPTAYSTITLLLLVLAALAVGTIAYARWLDARPHRAWPFAFAAAWLVLFPLSAAAGLVIEAPAYPEANLALEEPTLLAPQGRVTTVIYHLGGNDAPRGSLRVEALANGTRVASTTNDALLSKGGRWVVDLSVPNAGRNAKSVTVRLASSSGSFVYSSATPTLRVGHYDTTLATASFTHDARGTATVRFANAGDVALPPGALRLVALASGASSPAANVTNDAPIPAQGVWSARFAVPPGPAPGAFELRVTSTDDGHAYVRETRTPDVGVA